MALVEQVLSGYAPITPVAAAAPTTAETITAPTYGTWLEVIIGGTATTVTVLRPGNNAQGDAAADWVPLNAATNTTRWLRIGKEFADTDGNADVTFSQVTGVTARLWRV